MFKKDWQRCERTEIREPDNPTYAPDARRMVCTCLAFVRSRFLICKHVVQLHHPVPAHFFAEVRRERTLPIWRHTDLAPIDSTGGSNIPIDPDLLTEDIQSMSINLRVQDTSEQRMADFDPFEDVEDEGELEEDGGGNFEEEETGRTGLWTEGETVGERLLQVADVTERFSRAVRYQAAFHDARFLATLERESRAYIRFAKACLEHERVANSTRTANPKTWGSDSAYTMFFRTRPREQLSASNTPIPSSDVDYW